jgi:hypothetical protein
MKCFGKTNHKPHFQYMCTILHFLWDCFDFWNIGVERDVVMDAIYKSEKKEKKL